jgi:hypothetical protein
VPFVRVSRDKRGYQQVYLMDTLVRRGRPVKPLLLYWYRTPPGIRVGRDPFDPDSRRAIEAQNPGVVFDWEKLSVLPVVPVEAESWRERRQAERMARQLRRESSDAPAESAGDTAGVEAVLDTPTSEGEVSADPPAEASRRRRKHRHRRPAEATPAPPDLAEEPPESEPSDAS